MLYYEILRGQWILAALGGGLVLLLTAVMSYLAIWRERPGQPGDCGGEHPAPLSFLQALPAVLLMTYLGIAIFMMAYFAGKIASPPNW
ncbi:hypothetical protein [Fundidesulfovibrio soli]|uniref:hypothetical protein n=1 Tax=Fundidesulfovibrio soli TaxID=2922716 RepID=UPI001FAF9C60|nr:hypothetical protein [Fundidesulfovibrio soli]